MDAQKLDSVTNTLVSSALALARQTGVEPTKIRVPGYDSTVLLVPQQHGAIRVVAHQSLLINNLLYTYDGYMRQHTDKRWYFVSASTIIPTLAPKLKVALMDAVSEAVNAFMEANPGYLDIFDVLARKQEISTLRNEIDRLTRNNEQNQRYIDNALRVMKEGAEAIVEKQAKLDVLLAEDRSTEADVADATAMEGTVIGVDPDSLNLE